MTRESAINFIMTSMVFMPLMHDVCFGMDPANDKKVGIYWGAFDPMTEAHAAIIKAALKQEQLDEILVVVNDHGYKKYLCSLEQRVGFIRNILGKVGIKSVRVLTQDDTCKLNFDALKQTIAGDLYAISGYDSYSQWREHDKNHERANYTKILVAPRGDAAPDFFDVNAKILLIDERYKHISSTEIRKDIRGISVSNEDPSTQCQLWMEQAILSEKSFVF